MDDYIGRIKALLAEMISYESVQTLEFEISYTTTPPDLWISLTAADVFTGAGSPDHVRGQWEDFKKMTAELGKDFENAGNEQGRGTR